MKTSSFRTGTYLEINFVPYKILRVLGGETYQLEKQRDYSIVNKSKETLLYLLEMGSLRLLSQQPISNQQRELQSQASTLSKDLASYPKKKQKAALRKLEYVKFVSEQSNGRPTAKGTISDILCVARKLGEATPPAEHTVYTWWRIWQNSGNDVCSLIDKDRQTGVGQRKYRGRFEEIYNDVLDMYFEGIYDNQRRFVKQDIFDLLMSELYRINEISARKLDVPSRAKVYRMLDTLEPYEVLCAKKGKRAADNYFRATGRGVIPTSILSRVEVDHTPLDIILLDDETLKPIGRASLTMIVDKYSRSALGFYLGHETNSEFRVMMALRHAILPKFYIGERYPEIENQWLAYGIPFVLACDNGLEFHSAMLRRMCVELNIELVFCPKKQPHYKGAVERYLGTVNRSISHKLHGSTFSNPQEKGDYDSEKYARVTVSDARELIHMWVVDIYNQKPNRTTRLPPDVLWRQGLEEIEPILPESRDALNLVLCKEYQNRALRHDGVTLLHLKFNSIECTKIRNNYKFEGDVTIRVDLENLGHIYIYDSFSDEYVKIPCTEPEYAEGLTFVQHRLICREILRIEKESIDEKKLIQAKRRLWEKIKNLNDVNLLKERLKLVRAKESGRDEFRETSVSDVAPTQFEMQLGFENAIDLSKVPKFRNIN